MSTIPTDPPSIPPPPRELNISPPTSATETSASSVFFLSTLQRSNAITKCVCAKLLPNTKTEHIVSFSERTLTVWEIYSRPTENEPITVSPKIATSSHYNFANETRNITSDTTSTVPMEDVNAPALHVEIPSDEKLETTEPYSPVHSDIGVQVRLIDQHVLLGNINDLSVLSIADRDYVCTAADSGYLSVLGLISNNVEYSKAYSPSTSSPVYQQSASSIRPAHLQVLLQYPLHPALLTPSLFHPSHLIKIDPLCRCIVVCAVTSLIKIIPIKFIDNPNTSTVPFTLDESITINISGEIAQIEFLHNLFYMDEYIHFVVSSTGSPHRLPSTSTSSPVDHGIAREGLAHRNVLGTKPAEEKSTPSKDHGFVRLEYIKVHLKERKSEILLHPLRFSSISEVEIPTTLISVPLKTSSFSSSSSSTAMLSPSSAGLMACRMIMIFETFLVYFSPYPKHQMSFKPIFIAFPHSGQWSVSTCWCGTRLMILGSEGDLFSLQTPVDDPDAGWTFLGRISPSLCIVSFSLKTNRLEKHLTDFLFATGSCMSSSLIRMDWENNKISVVNPAVMEGYAPILDYTFVDLKNDGIMSMVSVSGIDKFAALRILTNGLGVDMLGTSDTNFNFLRGLHSLRRPSDSFPELLLCSFVSSSRLLKMQPSNELIDWSEQIDIANDNDTQFSQFITDDILLQVCSNHLRTIRVDENLSSSSVCFEWKCADNERISVCDTRNECVLILVVPSSTLYVGQISNTGSVVFPIRLDISPQVSMAKFVSLPQSMVTSALFSPISHTNMLLCVGTYSGDVLFHRISFAPAELSLVGSLSIISTLKCEMAIPDSLLTLDSHTTVDEHLSFDGIFIGLRNGYLLQLSVDLSPEAALLNVTVRNCRQLGVLPVQLIAMNTRKSLNYFIALSKHSWLIQVSTLNLLSVHRLAHNCDSHHMVHFPSKNNSGILVSHSGDRLNFLSIASHDSQMKNNAILPTRMTSITYQLPKQAHRILHLPTVGLFMVTYISAPGAKSENSSLAFLDAKTFKECFRWEGFEDDEKPLCVKYLQYPVDPQSSDGRNVVTIVLGTAIGLLFRKGMESDSGRVLILQISIPSGASPSSISPSTLFASDASATVPSVIMMCEARIPNTIQCICVLNENYLIVGSLSTLHLFEITQCQTPQGICLVSRLQYKCRNNIMAIETISNSANPTSSTKSYNVFVSTQRDGILHFILYSLLSNVVTVDTGDEDSPPTNSSELDWFLELTYIDPNPRLANLICPYTIPSSGGATGAKPPGDTKEESCYRLRKSTSHLSIQTAMLSEESLPELPDSGDKKSPSTGKQHNHTRVMFCDQLGNVGALSDPPPTSPLLKVKSSTIHEILTLDANYNFGYLMSQCKPGSFSHKLLDKQPSNQQILLDTEPASSLWKTLGRSFISTSYSGSVHAIMELDQTHASVLLRLQQIIFQLPEYKSDLLGHSWEFSQQTLTSHVSANTINGDYLWQSWSRLPNQLKAEVCMRSTLSLRLIEETFHSIWQSCT